jgi:hypothetical protein
LATKAAKLAAAALAALALGMPTKMLCALSRFPSMDVPAELRKSDVKAARMP